jgi:hypothetical protein
VGHTSTRGLQSMKGTGHTCTANSLCYNTYCASTFTYIPLYAGERLLKEAWSRAYLSQDRASPDLKPSHCDSNLLSIKNLQRQARRRRSYWRLQALPYALVYSLISSHNPPAYFNGIVSCPTQNLEVDLMSHGQPYGALWL